MSTRASEPLIARVPHKHIPRNVNHVHKAERVGFNQRIAIIITNALGSVPCMYIFVILAIIGFPGFVATPQQYVQWLSQTFIQLVALSVLGISQNVLSRHAELMADEQFATTQKTYADIETLIAQHNETIIQNSATSTKLDAIVAKLPIVAAQNDAIFAQNDKILDLLSEMQKPKPTPRSKQA